MAFSKLIPNRGAWLEFETSKRDLISVKVDRKRKLPVSILLRAIQIVDLDEETLNFHIALEESIDDMFVFALDLGGLQGPRHRGALRPDPGRRAAPPRGLGVVDPPVPAPHDSAASGPGSAFERIARASRDRARRGEPARSAPNRAFGKALVATERRVEALREELEGLRRGS